MKKLLSFIFIFFIFLITNSYAINYINDVSVKAGSTGTRIDITATDSIKYSAGSLSYNKKIYFDFFDTIVREKKTVNVNDGRIVTVRAAQNATKPKYISRVVLDMVNMEDYNISLSEDKKTLSIVFGAIPAFSINNIQPIEKKIIVLDPGHGGKDPGATISDLVEKTLNLDIAKRVQALLESDYRFEVYMTRETDVFIELIERAKFANNKNADLFVSIHNNSMPKGFSGTMLLYNESRLQGNKNLAENFQEKIEKASGLAGIGVRLREDLVVLKNIDMPGVLVEVACMSNIKDRRELRKDSFKQKIAQAIYESIVDASF